MAYIRIFFFLFVMLYGNCCGKTKPSVIVIGAGASGIAAATKLLKNGVENVKILEAENRIGGRVHSVNFGGSYVDLGAEWCYGQRGNAVYDLVKKSNVLVPNADKTPILIHSKLKTMEPDFAEQLFEIFEEVYEEDRKSVKESLGDYVGRKYRNTIEKLWSKNSRNLKVAREAIDLLEKTVLSFEGAFSWFSVAAATDYVQSGGNRQLGWNGHGYKTVLEVMMQTLPDPMEDKILLNKEVSQIDWNSMVEGEEKVVVACADGTQYVADHVILTTSLGVLKNQHKTLIVPNLTEEKIQAVEQLGFEAVFKMMLYFEHPWWKRNFPGYSFVWDADDVDQFSGSQPQTKSWTTSFLTLMPVSGSRNVLSAWFTGQFVPEIERCSDEVLINGFMHLMTKFGAWTNPIRPDNLTRHAWYSNPHFKGTYSYQTLQARADCRSKEETLSEPLATPSGKLSLLFAGEATHPTHFGSVHGAIETGFREADRLLKIYNPSE